MPRESSSGQVSQWGLDYSDNFLYMNKPGSWAISPYTETPSSSNSALNILDRVHYMPHFAKGTQTITAVSMNVNGTGGTTFRMGIYLPNKDLYPARLLAQATVDASSLGQKSTSIGPVSVRGLFFVAGVLQGTTVTYAATGWNVNAIYYETGANPNNSLLGPTFHTTGVSGSMVDNPIIVEEYLMNRMPRMYVKFA